MELGGITFIDVIYTIPYETPVSIYVFVLCYGYCLAFDLATKSQGLSAVSIEIDIILVVVVVIVTIICESATMFVLLTASFYKIWPYMSKKKTK